MMPAAHAQTSEDCPSIRANRISLGNTFSGRLRVAFYEQPAHDQAAPVSKAKPRTPSKRSVHEGEHSAQG